jgi:protein-disulfide isomerase
LIQQVLDRYPREVKFAVKHYPLASHKYARKATSAALAAYRQGKFWEFHDMLFKNYRALNDEKIQDIARGLDLDMVAFNRDMVSPAINMLIKRDIRNGREVGLRGIPAFFINGKKLKKRTPEGFQEMIEAELKKRE